jgi:hypothetical protein
MQNSRRNKVLLKQTTDGYSQRATSVKQLSFARKLSIQAVANKALHVYKRTKSMD